jgi:predicted amidophosphoribosyltransferase
MPLASCPRCAKMYQKIESQTVCPDCTEAENKDQDAILDFVASNPGCKPAEVAAATGVPMSSVLRAIDMHRITEMDKATEGVKCGRCGAPAISLAKKLCEKCLAKLNDELAREKASIKLPPKKELERESTKSTIRRKIDEAGGAEG